MKIALIIEHFDATRGGAEHFTVWLAQQLHQRGHEVHIVCHDVAAKVNKYRQATQRASHDRDRSHQAYPPEEPNHAGLHIHRLRGMKLNSGFGFRLFGRRAQRWCKQNKPDIAHSMSVAFAGDIYHPHAGVYAEIQTQAVASRATGTSAKFKQLMLHFSGKQRTLIALEKRAVKPHPITGGGPRCILSLCKMMTDQLHRHYDPLGPKVVELPNPRMTPLTPIDPTELQAARDWFRGHYKLSPTDKVAVFVGHDFRRKGLRYAIEAVAKTKDWKLLVVGLGKAREYVELADSLGIGDANTTGRRILFVGPTREMQKVYAASDALLLPTFYDSFGLVVLEAFSFDLPVISTEFLGANYLVKQHHAGTIVPSPKHITEMAAALESLPEKNSPDALALAARAKQASTGMLPEEYLKKVAELYLDVAKQK